MTDSPHPHDAAQDPTDAAAAATVSGGGSNPADALASDPIRRAAAQLELLSPQTREQVLEKMDESIAQRIRDFLASQPDNRPHGQFSTDVTTRRRMIHEMADRVAARRTAETDQQVQALGPGTRHAGTGPSGAMGGMTAQPPYLGAPGMPGAPGAPMTTDPLERLRELHPAAIARAMQGERAEAWAIVLDRLDVNARAALQLYLDATARAAIEDARSRQAQLAASSPALLSTIEAAIARTVVPRAMREHQQLLSTTPLAWTSMPA